MTIIEGQGASEAIKGRVDQIKAQIENLALIMIKKNCKNVLAKLAGGVAVIKVGAATETEMKEKKDRIEDALNATRAAVEEGIVAGGGVALFSAQKAVDALKLEGDEKLGAQIVVRALEEPLRIIADNAGFEASVVVNKVRTELDNIGFDAKTGEYVDMIAEGIIDPAKVTRSAIQNAASIAGLLLTTEAIICEIPEEKKEAAPMTQEWVAWAAWYLVFFYIRINYKRALLNRKALFWYTGIVRVILLKIILPKKIQNA